LNFVKVSPPAFDPAKPLLRPAKSARSNQAGYYRISNKLIMALSAGFAKGWKMGREFSPKQCYYRLDRVSCVVQVFRGALKNLSETLTLKV